MRFQLLSFVVLAAAAPVLADVVSYEASSAFPDELAWGRSLFCTPERALQNGWFFQEVQARDCFPPPEGGDQDNYTRPIDEFEGAETFFLEWRMQVVAGQSSEFPWGGPSVLSAWNLGGETYWFAIARDQVKFIQDVFTVILFVDIDPDVPHTHRLEIYGDQVYDWYIDGEVAYSGTPGGPYPSFFPSITWRAKAAFTENTVKWDYIRYGTIPLDGSGDFNTDGEVGPDDVYFFQECFSTPGGSWPGCAWADMDFDGGVDCDDWALFLQAWTDPADPPPLPECDNPADLDGDGDVDAADLAQLLSAWGPCPQPCTPGDPAQTCPADFDGDCTVNAADLAELLSNWG